VLPLAALGVTFLAVYAGQALAIRKGRSRMGWMWVAALLGPIPLLILLILPSKLPFEQTPGS
ncbi:MAG: hypothetical protein ACRECI_09560, partial [Methyloceanibacter sp.]